MFTPAVYLVKESIFMHTNIAKLTIVLIVAIWSQVFKIIQFFRGCFEGRKIFHRAFNGIVLIATTNLFYGAKTHCIIGGSDICEK